MTSSEINAQIADIQTNKIPALERSITSANQNIVAINANRWGGGTCSLTGNTKAKKQSYENCKADNAKRDGEIKTLEGVISGANKEIQAYKATLEILQKNLVSAQATSNDVQMILADKGKTMDGVAKESEGIALAQQKAAELTAAAQADAIRQAADVNAANDKKSKNVQLIIIISVAAVGLAIATIFIIKKLKKKA